MKRLNGQHGVTMLEIMVAVGILGVAGVALLLGLSSAFRAQDISREQVQGENLARAQLEYVRELTFIEAGGYGINPDVFIPSDYLITITTDQYCDGVGEVGYEPCYSPADIQLNTVRVFREGKGLVVVEDLKTRR